MTRQSIQKIFYVIEYLVVLVFLLAWFTSQSSQVEFHMDEKDWIATSGSFEAFIRGDFDSPIWSENYWALVQPPLARYFIGVGRWVGGFSDTDFQLPAEFYHSIKKIDAPLLNDQELLIWSRMPMAVLAAISGLILFFIGKEFFNRLVGYMAIFLYFPNKYITQTLCRAMSESPLLVPTLLTIIVLAFGLLSIEKRQGDSKPIDSLYLKSGLYFGSIGLLSGLASEAKLNGATLLLAGFFCILLITILLPKTVTKLQRIYFIVLSTFGMVLIAYITFVVLNPFLYDSPIQRSLQMLELRTSEMKWQTGRYHESFIQPTISAHITLFIKRVFSTYNTIHFRYAWVMNFSFFSLGLYSISAHGLNWVKRNNSIGAISIGILAVLISVYIPSLISPLDWDRYYLLPVVISILVMSIGVSKILQVIGKLFLRNTTYSA